MIKINKKSHFTCDVTELHSCTEALHLCIFVSKVKDKIRVQYYLIIYISNRLNRMYLFTHKTTYPINTEHTRKRNNIIGKLAT